MVLLISVHLYQMEFQSNYPDMACVYVCVHLNVCDVCVYVCVCVSFLAYICVDVGYTCTLHALGYICVHKLLAYMKDLLRHGLL